MEKKQIRSITAIQTTNTKKGNDAKLDPKRIQKDRQKGYARRLYRQEIRRAFMSGWKQALQHGQDSEKNKQEEISGESVRLAEQAAEV